MPDFAKMRHLVAALDARMDQVNIAIADANAVLATIKPGVEIWIAPSTMTGGAIGYADSGLLAAGLSGDLWLGLACATVGRA